VKAAGKAAGSNIDSALLPGTAKACMGSFCSFSDWALANFVQLRPTASGLGHLFRDINHIHGDGAVNQFFGGFLRCCSCGVLATLLLYMGLRAFRRLCVEPAHRGVPRFEKFEWLRAALFLHADDGLVLVQFFGW
jgi:hypothetical protein